MQYVLLLIKNKQQEQKLGRELQRWVKYLEHQSQISFLEGDKFDEAPKPLLEKPIWKNTGDGDLSKTYVSQWEVLELITFSKDQKQPYKTGKLKNNEPERTTQLI